MRALYRDILARKFEGGSTLTAVGPKPIFNETKKIVRKLENDFSHTN